MAVGPSADGLPVAIAGRGRGVVPVLIVVLLSTLPFAGKAFHIDDVAFVAVAESIRKDPLHPFRGAVALDDEDRRVFAGLGRAPNTFEAMSHPPLLPYFLAGTALLTGGVREAPAHVLYAVFPAMAALFFHRLAARFTGAPLGAALLLVSCPIFVLSAQSLMSDMPMLALSLGAIATFIEGLERQRPRTLVLSGLLAGLAVLARYVAFALPALFVAYAFLHRRSLKEVAPALAAICLPVGAWFGQNLLLQGRLHLIAAGEHYVRYYEGRSFGLGDIARKGIADLSGLGGTALPVFALLLLTGQRRRAVLSAGSVLAALLLCVVNPFGLAELRYYSPLQRAALLLFLSAGLFLVLEAFSSARRREGAGRADVAFLLFWLALMLAGTVLVLPFGTARYMLPVLPPLILLLFRAGLAALKPPAAAAAIGLTLALAVAMALVDFEHAAGYERFARSLPTDQAAGRVWFIGEWGFRHYMEKAGHGALGSRGDWPAEGDLVVRAEVAGMHAMSPALAARVEGLGTVELEGRWPLRLMDAEAKAGYYSHAWGLLPYAFGRGPRERFSVYRVGSPPTAVAGPTR